MLRRNHQPLHRILDGDSSGFDYGSFNFPTPLPSPLNSAQPANATVPIPSASFQIFWAINGVAFLVLICTIIMCCRRRGDDFINRWVTARSLGNMSDMVYGISVVRRREEREESKKEDPEKRSLRLKARFEAVGVRTVSVGLFLQFHFPFSRFRLGEGSVHEHLFAAFLYF